MCNTTNRNILHFCITIIISYLTYLPLCSILLGANLRHFVNLLRHDIIGDEVGISAAAGTLGRIEEYDGSSDWDQYVECVKNFFLVNDIKDDAKQRAVFLSIVGLSTYKILRNLLMPDNSGQDSLSVGVRGVATLQAETFRNHGKVQVLLPVA